MHMTTNNALAVRTADLLALIDRNAPKLRDMPRSPERDAHLLDIIADYLETDFADDALRHSILLTKLNSAI